MKKKIISLLLVFLLLCSTAAVASENAWVETSKATPESYYGQSQSLAQTNLTTLSSEAYDAIEQLASSLDYDPVKLYYYVSNNVDYEPYFGVMAGPEWTLMQGAGNSFDQALLLSSLFREAGIQTRYVYGEIEVSADDAAKWLRSGNATQAATLLANSQIPTICIVDGYGNIVRVRKEHMWVEAKLPSESDWTPLDPSFKLYDYVEGMESAVDLTWSSNFLNEVLNTAEYDTNQGWLTSVNGTFITEGIREYADKTFEDIVADPEFSNRTFMQLFGYWKLNEEYSDSLPLTLPYSVNSTLEVCLEIPEEYHHKIRFKLGSINYGASTEFIAGKRVAIHFLPATKNDERLIEDAGGILNVTPYKVKMKPVLMIDCKSVAEGLPITLGERLNLITELSNDHLPYSYENDCVLTVGAYYAIIFDMGKVTSSMLEKHIESFNSTKNRLSINETTMRDEIDHLLYLTGFTYFYEYDFFSDVQSQPNNIRWYRPTPSQVITSMDLNVWCYENGMIAELDAGGMAMHIGWDETVCVGENSADELAFMLSTGMIGSSLEHEIFEHLYGIEAVSTMKILEEANARDIKIYTITQDNVDEVLQDLQLSEDVKDWIRSDVNTGFTIVIPEREFQIKTWNGIGYIAFDPDTGTGAYYIYGGLNGSAGKLTGGQLVEIPWWVGSAVSLTTSVIDISIAEQVIGNVFFAISVGEIVRDIKIGKLSLKEASLLFGLLVSKTMFWLFVAEHVGIVPAIVFNWAYAVIYKKVQGSINIAKSGDTISVPPGTYYEHVIVNKDFITLNGDDKHPTIIDGNSVGNVITITANWKGSLHSLPKRLNT